MQRKQFFFVCFLLALLTGVVACHKPIHAEPPVYASIKFNPDEPTRYGRAEPGDSVTVFVEVAYPGDYITEAEYFWSLTASRKAWGSSLFLAFRLWRTFRGLRSGAINTRSTPRTCC